jgi:hypothetical protein
MAYYCKFYAVQNGMKMAGASQDKAAATVA